MWLGSAYRRQLPVAVHCCYRYLHHHARPADPHLAGPLDLLLRRQPGGSPPVRYQLRKRADVLLHAVRLLAALAGIVSIGRSGICNGVNAVQPYDTDAIAACIIGGASFMGGKGTMLGTMLGVLIIRYCVTASLCCPSPRLSRTLFSVWLSSAPYCSTLPVSAWKLRLAVWLQSKRYTLCLYNLLKRLLQFSQKPFPVPIVKMGHHPALRP